eukprot:3510204-Prymnesium_polylepis.1
MSAKEARAVTEALAKKWNAGNGEVDYQKMLNALVFGSKADVANNTSTPQNGEPDKVHDTGAVSSDVAVQLEKRPTRSSLRTSQSLSISKPEKRSSRSSLRNSQSDKRPSRLSTRSSLKGGRAADSFRLVKLRITTASQTIGRVLNLQLGSFTADAKAGAAP